MNNKKKILIVALLMTLIVVIGGSFALLNYSKTINNQSVIAGDIYMKYTNGKEIVLNSLTPSDTYDENSYFEFKIEGTNDSTKDIWYDVVLSYGDPVNGRTERIKDYLLKFRLVEIINGEEKVVVDDQSYSDLQNRRIYANTIKSNTTEKVDITYRLYMWVASGLILVGNTEDAIYDIDTWNNQVFASINVSVTGDFSEKEVPLTASQRVLKSIASHTTESCTPTVTDDNGTPEDESDDTIYFSGTNDCVNFNYVWYSGKLWRIVAINPDDSMKLVTQNEISAINWGETATYKDSWIKEWLNEDFKATLYNYQNIIVQNANWNAIRTTNLLVRPSKDGDGIVQEGVGLLNAYEYTQAYKNASTSTNYLNIGYDWWLITPYSDSDVWVCIITGGMGSNNSSSFSYGVRPSINIKSNIGIVNGDGTLANPYRINGDKEPGNSGELINTRLSGEYVKVDNKVYRIVDIENNTTKLTSIDYVRDAEGAVLAKNFGSNTSWADSVASGNNDYWGYYLNNTNEGTFEGTWLTEELNKYITDGTYYCGRYPSNVSYKNTICNESNTTAPTKSCEKTSSTWTGLVGLPRVGEMFSAQLGSGSSSSSSIWLITPCSSSDGRFMNNAGNSNNCISSSSYAEMVRPSINLKSEVIITGGDGMSPTTAYTIGLPE